MTFEDRITDYLPPRHRPGHLRRLMAMLEREPDGRARPTSPGPLEQIAATVRKRGLIVLISDLLAPADALRTPARLPPVAGARGDRPARPRPGRGRVRVRRRRRCSRTSSRAASCTSTRTPARAEYLGRFAAHAAELERACADLGIEFQTITTDRPLELVLFDFLKARMRRGRSAGPTAPSAGRGGRR